MRIKHLILRTIGIIYLVHAVLYYLHDANTYKDLGSKAYVEAFSLLLITIGVGLLFLNEWARRAGIILNVFIIMMNWMQMFYGVHWAKELCLVYVFIMILLLYNHIDVAKDNTKDHLK